MTPSTIKEILDIFKLSYGGDGKVARGEIVDASAVSHVSDPSKPILPWHTYAGQTLPEETLEQVKEVRAMVRAFDPKLPKVPATPELIAAGCNKDKCFMFTDSAAFRAKLVAEIQADAASVKAEMDAEAPGQTKTAKRIEYMKIMAFKHLMNGREGPTSAINTYDPAIVTWGMGWALKGGLPRVLGRLYEIEAAQSSDPEKHFVQKFFYLCGFMYDAGKYYVVDTEKATVWIENLSKPKKPPPTPPPGETKGEALRVLHDVEELHFMWVQAARDDLTRATITRAQRDVFVGPTGTGTVAQADKIQTAALYTFLAHLQHWTGDKFDFVAWAQGPNARPKLSASLPSAKGDEELAIQAVHRFYNKRSPDIHRNIFTQVRTYWKEMTVDDTKDEGLTDFHPNYPIMTNPPVTTSVPEGHLAAKVDDAGKTIYDLGPLEDFGRTPPAPAQNPAQSIILIPPTLPEPVGEDPAAEDLAKEEAKRAAERSAWARLFEWIPF